MHSRVVLGNRARWLLGSGVPAASTRVFSRFLTRGIREYCPVIMETLDNLNGRVMGNHSPFPIASPEGARKFLASSSQQLGSRHATVHCNGLAKPAVVFKNYLHATVDERDENSGSSRSPSPSPVAFGPNEAANLLQGVMQYKQKNASALTIEGKVRELCQIYVGLDTDAKATFLHTLSQKFGIDHNVTADLSKALLDAAGKNEFHIVRAEENLREALSPKYKWLFGQIGRIERGVKFLVDMRTDVLELIGSLAPDASGIPYLRALNTSLRDLLTMWFSVGFLELERITWQSPCEMLQKISDYEAVHPMRNWTDLKRRVGPYRRCFVYVHSSMPGEPIVVLHTALTNEISSSMKNIVVTPRMLAGSPQSRRFSCGVESESVVTTREEDPNLISTAIFYSITSTQKGLHGIELGNYLIKSVVKELQMEFPKMHQFSSLSPIPDFRNWLLNQIRSAEKGSRTLFLPAELESLQTELRCTDASQFWSSLKRIIELNSWIQEENLVEKLETPLMRLCAQYLYAEKRRGYALDSVANFHLRNGAVIWRLNWLADRTPRGLTNSCGIMVNYRYFLDACEEKSQNYLEKNHIEASDQVRHLTKLAQSISSNNAKPIEGKL